MSRLLWSSFAVAIITAGCAAPPSAQAPLRPVRVATDVVESVSLPASFEAGGMVRAHATAVIASRIMAPIVAVHVRAGDRVRRDGALISLDNRETEANCARAHAALMSTVENLRAAESDVRAADAAVTLARATHVRVAALRERQSATPHELDQAVAALDAADAQLAGAHARVAAAAASRDAAQAAADAADAATTYAVLTAPFDGIVAERSVDPGAMAYPAASLLTLEDTSAFTLDVTLDEARARQLVPGQRVVVELDHAEDTARTIDGRVAEIARVDPESHAFVVKIQLSGGSGFRAGIFGRARFTRPERPTIAVPGSAVIRRGQLTFVFVVDSNNRVRLQPISPGVSLGDRLEVLAGVHAGDKIVKSPPAELSDGMQIEAGR